MRSWLILFISVAAISPAALLIRVANVDASPLVIGAYRLSIAALIVVPAALVTSHKSLDALRRDDLWLLLISGVCLALHLAFWITSLSYTSIASSVVLVTTTPLMLAVLPRRWTSDVVTRRTIAGIAVALVGTAVIAYADAGTGQHRLFGDALALLGAAAMAGHRVLGRRLMSEMPLMPYVAVTYPVAAVVLLAGAVASGAALSGFSTQTYGAVALLALGPQIIGHSAANWSLQRMSAVAVSTAIMAEPVGASILAAIFLAEFPGVWVIVGGVAVLAGIALTVGAERPNVGRTESIAG